MTSGLISCGVAIAMGQLVHSVDTSIVKTYLIILHFREQSIKSIYTIARGSYRKFGQVNPGRLLAVEPYI